MTKCFSHLLVNVHHTSTACPELTSGLHWSQCGLLLYSHTILECHLGRISPVWKTLIRHILTQYIRFPKIVLWHFTLIYWHLTHWIYKFLVNGVGRIIQQVILWVTFFCAPSHLKKNAVWGPEQNVCHLSTEPLKTSTIWKQDCCC